MRLLRRLVPRIGFLTVAGFAWRHRGTVLRTADLVRNAPRLLREDGTGELAQHAKALLALDQALPTDVGVRISGIEHGSVTLAGDPGPRALTEAEAALCRLAGITDVRADGSTHAAVA